MALNNHRVVMVSLSIVLLSAQEQGRSLSFIEMCKRMHESILSFVPMPLEISPTNKKIIYMLFVPSPFGMLE